MAPAARKRFSLSSFDDASARRVDGKLAGAPARTMAIFPRRSGSSPAWPYPANASSPSRVRSDAPQSPATRTSFTFAPSTMSRPCARVSHSFTRWISPAEVADAAQAALFVGMEDRAAFRGALRATLVKRGQDAPVFDRLFELYFTGAKDLVEGLQDSLLDALEREKLDDVQLEEIARMLAQMSPLTQALVAGRADQLARILRQAMLGIVFRGLQSPLQRGFYARRLLQA